VGDVAEMSAARTAGLVAAVLAATALTGCNLTSVKDEKVALRAVKDAVVLSAGAERPARDGDTLAKGDEVRTRSGGTVTLVVRDRRVVLGGATSVRVPDGATLDLTRGAVLVDRREGPGLTLRAGDTTVDNVGAGALRVERSFSVLVAALSAQARVRTATGPRLTLAPLYQVVVAGRALPAGAPPLQLRHDAWERAVVPGVLTDDDRLNDLAEGLDGPGAPAVPAAFTPGKGARTSDLVLAEAIGRAARKPGAAERARVLRGSGGSWGVVARLLDTSANAVGTALSSVLNGVPSAEPTTGPGGTPGTVAGPTAQPGVTPSPSPGGPSPSRTPGTRPPTSRPPTSGSPTSPSETPNVVDQLISGLPTPLLPDLGL
jgi:hypothetical protein